VGKKDKDVDIDLDVNIPPSVTADQLQITREIQAFHERIKRRSVWSENEILKMLQGAVDIALITNDVEKARIMFDSAKEIYLDNIHVNNRNYYVAAIFIGFISIAFVCSTFITFVSHLNLKNIADRETLIAIFTFSGMGSITSVLTRLSQLNFKNDMSRKFVIYSALAKPFVAISFASIVYIILQNKLVVIGAFDSDQYLLPMIWISSFMCGFSERFANDIISKVLPNSIIDSDHLTS